MTAALLERKRTHFVLWRPAGAMPPKLVIGIFASGSPPTLAGERTISLKVSPLANDLWEVAAADCGLTDGQVYHYWFEIGGPNPPGVRFSDPSAYCVDWRLVAAPPGQNQPGAPASVIRFVAGELTPSDSNAAPSSFDVSADVAMSSLPPNNRLVIYELPTAWTKTGDLVNATNVGVGTFQDVLALVRKSAVASNFSSVAALAEGRSHLQDLGINGLELLPPADTFNDRTSWGYGTSNYFAPDFDLGQPIGQPDSTAVSDFLDLVRGCHLHGIRFIYDAVMAFADHEPYAIANFADFHILWNTGDPEQSDRQGWGGDLWKYAYPATGFDPITGNTTSIFPARQHMLAHLHWWMRYYHVDGYRLDSVNNVRSWDFVGAFAAEGRGVWNDRWKAEGNPGTGNDRFLVVGEELSMPMSLLGRIDALWNERFRNRVRNAIVGRSALGQPSFEWTVREMIDCRNLPGFTDGSQAVNYIGSHDLSNTDGDGTNNDRIYNYLDRMGVALKDKPLKLAFVCLLTAVGIPMILAGDEFADPMNFNLSDPNVDTRKQTDPVNYDLVTSDPWRAQLFQYVSRLVKLRTTADALSVNDTEFIHIDFASGKRVLAWKRGAPGQDPVIVVANFSDWATDISSPSAEYRVSNWPTLPAGKVWREVTQCRLVPAEWAGREPVFAWEAKVYQTVAG